MSKTGKEGYTKGPWNVRRDDGILYIGTEGHGEHASILNGYGINAQDVANAHLIASAPDLLEAVKKAYSLTAPLSTYGRELEKLIARAEGRGV